MSPVAPTIVAVRPLRRVTGVVTTECSAVVSTIKVIDWPPAFIVTVGSRGPRMRDPSLPWSDSAPARLIRLWMASSHWYLSLLGPLNFFDPYNCPSAMGALIPQVSSLSAIGTLVMA